MAGAALAASLPGQSALGHQIAVGPFDRVTSIVAVILVPLLVLGLVGLPSLLAACIGLATGLSVGSVAGVALAASVVVAVPAGALVAEGGIAAARGSRDRPAAILCLALAWIGIGLVLGAAPLGPLARTAAALDDPRQAWVALATSCASGIALVCAWLLLAARRPERRAARSRTARSLVRGRHGAIPAAVAALLVRRSDVRFAAAGAVLFGAAGVLLSAIASAPAPVAFLLGSSTALLGAVFCPLVTCGALLDGRWLWRGGSRHHVTVAGAAALVATIGALLPVAVVGLAATVAARPSWSPVGAVATLVAVGSAAALAAGALTPWAGSGIGDQLTTFAAFAVIAIATSLVVGVTAPRLVALGIPDLVLAVLLSALSIGLATRAVGRRLGSPLL